MDPVNSPQTSTEQVTQDVTPAIPSTPVVQEAAATVAVPSQGAPTVAKWIMLLTVVILVIAGIVGYYFLVMKPAENANMQTTPTTTSDTPKVVVSPTPKNEQEAVDQLDTTFPTSEVNGIQTDLQSL